MARGVEFTLEDGETLTISDDEVRVTYNALWDLAEEPGAVSTSALLMDGHRLNPIARKPIVLTASQSTALREAVALVQVQPS